MKVGDGRVWRAPDGKIWVPRHARTLKNALYAIAHQGPAGHRGKEATLKRLQPHFWWTNMETEVEKRREQCLQCVKLANGKWQEDFQTDGLTTGSRKSRRGHDDGLFFAVAQ